MDFLILSGLPFIFRLLPLFLIVYRVVPARYKDAVLFGESILFYALGEPVFVVLLLALTVLNWQLGGRMLKQEKGKRRLYLAGSVLVNVLVLAGFKAGVSASFYGLLPAGAPDVRLPLGLSFYIFRMISWLADLYKEDRKETPAFDETAAYFIMFPHITQGPIMRWQEYRRRSSADLSDAETASRFEDGLVLFVLGLAMKVLLADRIGILWNEILKIGYESISTPLAWMGAYAYTFQLYYDFWGYSLLAAGTAMMLGFPFVQNFAHPYAAGSVSGFYRRWHATLGSWFRDYVYFPLGGSRKGRAKTFRNLLAVWLLTAIWHGSTLNFLIWGGSLFLMIALEKFVLKDAMAKKPFIGRFGVLVLVPLTWVSFAITDIRELGIYFSRLFPFFGPGIYVDSADYIRYAPTYAGLFAAGAILCVPAVFDTVWKLRRKIPVLVGLTVLFWICVYFLVTGSGNSFMYFDF